MDAASILPPRIRRRELLTGAALLGGALLASEKLAALGVASSTMAASDFLVLSQILTSRARLDPIIAQRAFDALSAEDRGFSAKARALHQAIYQAGFRDMRKYGAFISSRAEFDPTAKKIISAFYLGYTGTPEGEADTDNARFVAYAGALMYEPTSDATVVPTYSRGRTNYWVTPPTTLATD